MMRSARAIRPGPARIATIACAAIAAAWPALAETPLIDQGRDTASRPAPSSISISRDQHTRKLTLPAGKSMIVDLPSDASELFIGNPQVANAVVRSARRLFVMAVANGQTTIFAMDKAGQQMATLEIVVVGRDLTDLKAILNKAIPTNDISVQGIDDTVILTGSVASAVDAQKAYDIAQAYVSYSAVGAGGASSSGGGSSINFSSPQVIDGKLINSLTIRGQDQVMLKVQVVEIQRSIIKQLGINLNGGWGVANNGFSGGNSSTAYPTANNIFSTSQNTAGGLNSALNFVSQKNSLSASLQAYERNGVAHMLAEPTVTAISGETGTFSAGGTIPVSGSATIDPSTGKCTVTYQQQAYGVELDFTPTVLSEGRISIHMTTKVTEPDTSNAVISACANLPGLRTRSNTTTLELPSGGSIVSAGLIQKMSQQAIAGTPGLMNLPILGALFRSRDYQRSESELMIVVTPYLAKSLRPDQISKPDDGYADATDPQGWLLGRMNRIYSTADNPELVKTYKGRVGFIAD